MLMATVMTRMVGFAMVWLAEQGSFTVVVPFGRRVRFPRRMDMASRGRSGELEWERATGQRAGD